MLYTILQAGALILTVESAIFLAKGGLGLRAETIAELSTPYFGYNPYIVESLARQNANTWVGVMLLLGAATFQITSFWFATVASIGPPNYLGIFLAVVFGIFLFVFCCWWSRKYAARIAAKAHEIAQGRGARTK